MTTTGADGKRMKGKYPASFQAGYLFDMMTAEEASVFGGAYAVNPLVIRGALNHSVRGSGHRTG